MSINLQAIESKRWKALRQALEDMIQEEDVGLGHTRITRSGEHAICFEGGAVFCLFDTEKQELRLWNRIGKTTGASIPLRQLNLLEKIVQAWYAVYFRSGV